MYLSPLIFNIAGVSCTVLSPYVSCATHQSEGIARTGYFIPGRDGIPGLALARNSSAAGVAVAVVALQAITRSGC